MPRQLLIALSLLLVSLNAAAQWTYRTTEDKMRGEKSRFAELKSSNKEQLGFPYQGGSTLQIIVRHSPKHGDDVLLWLDRGQMPCLSECSFSAKFDGQEIDEWNATGPQNGSSNALFIDEQEKFLEKLKKSQRLIVEVNLYDHGSSQFSFNTKGLKWP